MLANYSRKILKNYKFIRDNKEKFEGHKMAKLIKEDFPNYLKNITPNPSEYTFKANAGQKKDSWTSCPGIAVLNSKISKKLGEGFFVIFIFSPDTDRLYLSLTQNIQEEWRTDKLREKASKYREKLGTNKKFGIEKLSLGDVVWFDKYTYANIYAKCYNLDNLPSEKEFESDYIEILELYNELINKLTGAHPPESNIRNYLEDILKDYKKAKDGELSEDKQSRINNLIGTEFPNYLNEFTQDKYQIFSSSSHKMQLCPYVAIIDKNISSKHIEGFYVNYMFREDMSGVYLALSQRFKGIEGGDDYKNHLKSKSEKYRNDLPATEVSSDLIGQIDLKYKDASYAPFYEAGTIYANFYETSNLPSDEKLKSDLNQMLNLYKVLIDIILNKFKSFSDYLNHKNFLYSSETLENFLLSLSVKPFVILTGSSGTGKTKIAQLFAEYLKRKNMANYVIIPVGANWTENRHLMGFYNVITSDYESTPALDLITDAHNNPDKTYFLILDEMNLSHVERYFSDFLSAMESGKEIELYSKHQAEAIKNKIIPQKLKIPDNLLVVGTVNVDETTYMFSPKVLDRANTIEFTTYPAHDYIMDIIKHQDLQGQVNLLESPLSHQENREANIAQLKKILDHVKIRNGDELWPILAREIHTFQDTLKAAGFDFGFRVINEILRFMYMAWLYEGSPPVWDNWERYFDAQIMQKMLPKIHGSQRELEVLLKKLFKLTYNGPYTDKPWVSLPLDEDKCKYPSSALKIQSLGRSLQEKRYASFTG